MSDFVTEWIAAIGRVQRSVLEPTHATHGRNILKPFTSGFPCAKNPHGNPFVQYVCSNRPLRHRSSCTSGRQKQRPQLVGACISRNTNNKVSPARRTFLLWLLLQSGRSHSYTTTLLKDAEEGSSRSSMRPASSSDRGAHRFAWRYIGKCGIGVGSQLTRS